MIFGSDVENKSCRSCGMTKPVSDFGMNRNEKDGLSGRCKECTNAAARQRRNRDPEKHRAAAREYYLANAEDRKAYGRNYYLGNSEKMRKAAKEWANNNPERRRELKRKSRETVFGSLNRRISAAVRRYLAPGTKAGRKWERILGYTVDDLKRHLEKKFLPGITWENRHLWHIDHIVPLSAHYYTSPEHHDFKRAWALSNLQPLWAKDNLTKHAKLTKPFQPSLPF